MPVNMPQSALYPTQTEGIRDQQHTPQGVLTAVTETLDA